MQALGRLLLFPMILAGFFEETDLLLFRSPIRIKGVVRSTLVTSFNC